MASNENKVLTKKDINKLALHSVLLQAGFNYERMQSCGFLQAQLPALKKIYKDDKAGLSAAMTDNLEFINTHPNLVGFLMGLLISMEESHEDRGIIKGLKVALFAPLAGIGDAIFWFTLLPIVAGICSSMAMEGSVMGPIIFFLVYLAIFIMRWFWTRLGYNLGVKAVAQITDISEVLAKAATVLGCTVIGVYDIVFRYYFERQVDVYRYANVSCQSVAGARGYNAESCGCADEACGGLIDGAVATACNHTVVRFFRCFGGKLVYVPRATAESDVEVNRHPQHLSVKTRHNAVLRHRTRGRVDDEQKLLACERHHTILFGFFLGELHQVSLNEVVEVAVHHAANIGCLIVGAVVFNAAVVEHVAADL